MFKVLFGLALVALVLFALPMTARAEDASQFPQLAKVYQTLAAGGRVKVAYFGGSITWGATASDPLKTSWRALVTKALESNYPQAHIEAINAAIGGQPSKLGVFRMDRDVLPYKPDLCFVEFAVNDWSAADGQETVEGIVRKLRASKPDMAIVLVIIGSGWDYGSPAAAKHIELANHYGLAYIDIFAAVKAKIKEGLKTKDILTDSCHPTDAGYRIYADIVLAELVRQAAAKGTPAPEPAKPLTPNRYEKASMIELAKLPDLGGWKIDPPSVVGTWFDQQPSRWFSSAVVPGKDGAELSTEVTCTGLGLYYEITEGGGPIVVSADGNKVLEIKTEQKFAFSRVMFSFSMLEGSAVRKVTLSAPQAAKTKAAYLLYTH